MNLTVCYGTNPPGSFKVDGSVPTGFAPNLPTGLYPSTITAGTFMTYCQSLGL